MANEKKMVVAADFGNSEIRLAAAYKNDDGALEILAQKTLKNSGEIRNGKVAEGDFYNDLTNIIKQIPVKQNTKIDGYCFSSGTHSLRSEIRNIEIATAKIKEKERKNAAMQMILNSNIRSIIDVFEIEFDKENLLSKFLIVSTLNNVKQSFINVKPQLDKKNFYKADYMIAPLVQAEVFMSEQQKKEGCLLIDFGADSTSVALYVKGAPHFCAVVPLGSGHITKDIAQKLDISLDDAEKIKKEQGLRDETETVEKRLSETLDFIFQELEKQKLKEFVKEILITGGGSQLKELPDFLQQYCGTVNFVHFDKNILSEMNYSKTLLYAMLQQSDKNYEVLNKKRDWFGGLFVEETPV
ncbi:MAG: pilus assembly protein PilM [Prevotellaceae bacterium]|jgi:cell division protein FtsA|nr:pilus assembly protein PilM [Prevotellaceae bacterium]